MAKFLHRKCVPGLGAVYLVLAFDCNELLLYCFNKLIIILKTKPMYLAY